MADLPPQNPERHYLRRVETPALSAEDREVLGHLQHYNALVDLASDSQTLASRLEAGEAGGAYPEVLEELGLTQGQAQEIIETRQMARTEANKLWQTCAERLHPHEVPLLKFPDGLDHLMEEIASGNRGNLTAKTLTDRFPHDYRPLVKNAAETATAALAQVEKQVGHAAEETLKKSGSGKTKWLVGGIIAAAVALGAFVAARKAPQPEQDSPSPSR